MPEGDGTTAVVIDGTQEHLYGCAVCYHPEDTPTDMHCEICRPGFMMHEGGCYDASMGTPTPNDEMCNNCADCLRFDRYGRTESVYKCNACLDGFYQEQLGGECVAPA